MSRSPSLLLPLAFIVTLSLAACDLPGATPGSTSSVTASPSATPAGAGEAPPSEPLTLANFPWINGSTAAIPLIKATMERLTGQPVDGEIGVSQTSDAWAGLVQTWTDPDTAVLFVYPPDEATRQTVADSGVALELAPIGRDALVFVTNAANPVSNLSSADIRAVYSGAVTSWAELGGADSPIVAYQRNEDSGSQALMRSLVMGSTSMIPSPAGLTAGGMLALILELQSYQNTANALGYSVYYYVSEMQAQPDLKILSVDGVAPTHATIIDGSYPFVTDFYAVIQRRAAAGSPARRIFEWIQSDEGRATAADTGYVPLPAGSPVTLDLTQPGPTTPGCREGLVLPAGVDPAEVCSEVWIEYPAPTAWVDEFAAQIASPSGNITCQLTAGWVTLHGTTLRPNTTCTIREADYIDADLGGEAQIAFSVTDEGPGQFLTQSVYFGDFADWDAADSQVVEYGAVVATGEMACRSAEAGMTCWDSSTQHGFFVSRSAFATW
ncbi:MAG: substrate-binding domain-containing protein [Propionibacteriaceae bacterium]|jgi:phosphate transport system substrate-binding protein|nr:substrate-binding domain-containing protein [Propionibacteriaceae bacterium]